MEHVCLECGRPLRHDERRGLANAVRYRRRWRRCRLGSGRQLLEKLVFGRYCVGKDGDHFDLQEASLDWLITDARRQDLVEPSPQQKAMAELLGTDLTQAAS